MSMSDAVSTESAARMARVPSDVRHVHLIGVAGTAKVVREGYPDHTAWDPTSEHPDPKSSPDKPIWFMVDIAPDRKFDRIVTVDEMRAAPELRDMVTLKRGNRFSITPVTEEEFETIIRLGTETRD